MRRLMVSLFVQFACCLTPVLASRDHFEGPSGEVLTRQLQAFLDGQADTLILPSRGEDYLTGPLYIRRNNLVLVLEAGAVLRAAPNAFPDPTHSLISVFRKNNIVIRGGDGARLVMGGKEYTSGEWRHAIRLQGVRKAHISGLDIDSSGGDGIYVGSAWDHGIDASEDVVIENCRLNGNRRQGISVISARRLQIRSTLIRGTSGTAPAAGIDFEPNRPDEVLEDCIVSDTRIEDNDGHGALVWLGKLNKTSRPISISFVNVVLANSRRNSGFGFGGSFHDGLTGSITMRHSTLSENHISALLIEGLAPESIEIHVDSCVLMRSSARRSIGRSTNALIVFGSGKSRRHEAGGLRITHSLLDGGGGGRLFSPGSGMPDRYRDVLIQGHWNMNEHASDIPPGITWERMEDAPKL